MTAEMRNRLQELLMNEEFSNKVIMATSIPEEISILTENGIEITADELQGFGDEAMSILKEDGYISEDGELSSEMLEYVCGGRGRSRGKGLAALGLGMMGTALVSDFLAGACAFALVSNPVGWFFGGAAVLVAGGYVMGKSRRR